MPDKDLKQVPARLHALQLEGREKLSVIGVTDVSGFEDARQLAEKSVSHDPAELHIERIDLDAGVLELRGRVQELSYDEPARGGLLSRVFG